MQQSTIDRALYPQMKAGGASSVVTSIGPVTNGKVKVSGTSLSTFQAICGTLTATGNDAWHDPIYPFCWTD